MADLISAIFLFEQLERGIIFFNTAVKFQSSSKPEFADRPLKTWHTMDHNKEKHRK